MLVAALEKEREGVERLRQLDAAKNEFVSTVSHELRTPMTSIVGYTEMLRDGSLGEPPPEQQQLVEAIARNGERLLGRPTTCCSWPASSRRRGLGARAPSTCARAGTARGAIGPCSATRDLDVDYPLPDEVVRQR